MKTLKSSKTLRCAARHATLQAQGLKSFAYKTGMKTTSIYITENMLEEIMTERLQQAIERLQQLPDAAQNAIAERILDEIDEQERDEIVKKPHMSNTPFVGLLKKHADKMPREKPKRADLQLNEK